MNERTRLFAACMSKPWSQLSDFGCKSVQNPNFTQRADQQSKRAQLLSDNIT